MRSGAADSAAGTDPAEAAANSLSKWGWRRPGAPPTRYAERAQNDLEVAAGIQSEYEFENSLEHLLTLDGGL